MIDPKDITIIIPHLGANEESRYAIKQCLVSLRETAPDINKIIVLNGGIKHADDIFESEIKNEKVIILEEQGQCKAVNAAAATVNTPWIMVSNDDMVYPPGWFEHLTDSLLPTSICISAKLVEPRSGAPTFLVEFCGGAGGDFDKVKFYKYVEQYLKNRIENNAVDFGFNLPFLIRKDLWDTVGGYDINYDPWGSNSDSDLEYKIRLAGIQSFQHQECLVYHFSQTSGTFHPDNQGAWQKNWDYFIQKWGFPRTDDGIWEATFTIPDEGRKFRPEWEGKYK